MESELRSKALILSSPMMTVRLHWQRLRGWEQAGPQSIPKVGFGPQRTEQNWGRVSGFGSWGWQ